MNHRIEATEPIDLIGNRFHVSDMQEVTDHRGFSAGCASHRLVGARLVAAVENDPVTLFDQELACHKTKPG